MISERIDVLSRDLLRETEKREESQKYMNRVIEDVQSRYRDAMLTFNRIEMAFNQHLSDDRKMTDSIVRIDNRLRTVERMVWIAVGGIIIIGASIPIATSIILRYL